MSEFSLIQKIIIFAIPILFAITVHEVAHGWVASKLGDKTALLMGRITLNPFKHIDLIGTIIVPLVLLTFGGFIFGWAKPVPVNFKNLHHPRRDMIIVAAAGPFSNLLMALAWGGLFIFTIPHVKNNIPMLALATMAQAGVLINILLMVINLIPIPPLDGGRVLAGLLPPRLAYHYDKIEPFGFLIVLALLVSGALVYVVSPVLHLTFKVLAGFIGR